MAASGWNPNQEKDQLSTSRFQADATADNRHILLIEDNKADIFMVQEAIENAHIGAALRVINDGHAATEFFNEVDECDAVPCPDLILLDMNLPKKSGDEVLKHLRNSSRCKSVPVVIVSSSDAPLDRGAVSGFSIAGWFKKASEYTEYMKLGSLIRNLLQDTPNRST